MSGRRILVVGPAWVGDTIMSQTLYSLLRDADPEVRIDVTAPAATRPLLTRMPEVSEAILFDVGHGELKLGYRSRFAGRLKAARYDQAIVLPNSFKSALVPMLAGISRRTGYLGEFRYFLLNDIRLLNPGRFPRMVDQFMALGVKPGKAIPPCRHPALGVDKINQRECLRRFELDPTGPILGLCPGAEYGDAKRWPAVHFAAVAGAAVASGMQVWLFGSPADEGTTHEIIEHLPPDQRASCHDLAGKTALLDAVDLLSLCTNVVSNDSGLMHVAAAVGCRVVVVYGSTSPDFTPPLTDRAVIESLNLECSPCFARQCPLGHRNCLNELSPELVISGLPLG